MDDSRLQALRALIEPLLADQAMELVELSSRPQGRQVLLRLLVDKVGGVTIQECARANQRVGAAIDEAGFMPDSYVIEVSSPGLDRPLASRRDFERAIGEDLQLEVRAGEGRTKPLEGMLLAVQPESVVLQTPAGNLTVTLAEIQRAVKALKW